MKPIVKLAKLFPVLDEALVTGVKALAAESHLDIDALEVKRIGGDEVKRMPSANEIETLKDGEHAIIQYVSTRDMDRDDEVLDPAGCVMAEFLKAPHVLWGHDYSQPPVGKDEWIRSDEYGIMAKTVYAPTPRGEELFALRKGGFLNTSSVGFVPLESITPVDGSTWNKAVTDRLKRWPEFQKMADKVRRITTKWLLLEHSDVSVPANINALTLAVAKGLKVSPELLKSLGVTKDHAPESAPTFVHRVYSPYVRLVKRAPTFVRKVSLDSMIASKVKTMMDLRRGKV